LLVAARREPPIRGDPRRAASFSYTAILFHIVHYAKFTRNDNLPTCRFSLVLEDALTNVHSRTTELFRSGYLKNADWQLEEK